MCKSSVVFGIFMVIFFSTVSSAGTIYVDAAATGANDGSSWATLTWEDYMVAPSVGGSHINVQIERDPSTGSLGILDCSVGPRTYPIRYSQGYGDTWNTTVVAGNSDGSDRWGLAFHPVTSMAYVSYQNGGSLILSHFDGSVWAAETIVSSGAGGGSSLAFDPVTCEPYVAYIGSGGVNLAWYDASGWHTEPIDSGFGSFSSPSLSFDPADDSVCVGYAHTFNGIYFARRIGAGNWNVSQVESMSFPHFPIVRYNPISGQPGLAYETSMGAPVKYAAFNGSGWDTFPASTSGHTCWDPLGLGYLADGTPIVVYTAGSFSSVPVSEKSFHVAWLVDGTFSILSEHDYGPFNWNGPVDMVIEGNTLYVAYQAVNIGVHLASVVIPEAVLPVEIDIKPGSYPNAVNLGSLGLIPVAILSSEEFDATSVDPESVELGGAGVEVRGRSNRFMAHEEDVNGDGLVDLVVHVATENLDPGAFQDGYAILSGKTHDGVSIEGVDEMIIVPRAE